MFTFVFFISWRDNRFSCSDCSTVSNASAAVVPMIDEFCWWFWIAAVVQRKAKVNWNCTLLREHKAETWKCSVGKDGSTYPIRRILHCYLKIQYAFLPPVLEVGTVFLILAKVHIKGFLSKVTRVRKSSFLGEANNVMTSGKFEMYLVLQKKITTPVFSIL